MLHPLGMINQGINIIKSYENNFWLKLWVRIKEENNHKRKVWAYFDWKHIKRNFNFFELLGFYLWPITLVLNEILVKDQTI